MRNENRSRTSFSVTGATRYRDRAVSSTRPSRCSQPRASRTGVYTTPWTAAQPYLQQGYNAASQLLNTGGQQYYPGQQVAPFSPLQEQAFGQVQNLAGAPNTVRS